MKNFALPQKSAGSEKIFRKMKRSPRKNRLAPFIALIFFAFVVPVYAVPNPFDEKFNHLQKDMSMTQVRDLLGSPDLRELIKSQEIWHFNQNGGRRVIFENGKVSEFGAETFPSLLSPSLANPIPAPTPEATPLPIGETCKKDKDCASGNCHFHTCSGKNNCSVPIGQTCATNADCCGGFCDFQVCKKR